MVCAISPDTTAEDDAIPGCGLGFYLGEASSAEAGDFFGGGFGLRRGGLVWLGGFLGGIGIGEAEGRGGFRLGGCGGAKGGGFGVGVWGGRCEAGGVCCGAGHGGLGDWRLLGYVRGAGVHCS